jgi:hypothetical protein
VDFVRKAVCSLDDIPGLIHGIRRAVYDQQELVGLESDVVFYDAIFGDPNTDQTGPNSADTPNSSSAAPVPTAAHDVVHGLYFLLSPSISMDEAV